MALGDSALYMRLEIFKAVLGGALVWFVAALTRDIYATAVANLVSVALSILFIDIAPAKRTHGYSALDQIKDILPVILLSSCAAVAGLAVQLMKLGYASELAVQCIVFAIVYLGGAKILKFKELSETVSLFRGFALGKH